MILVTGAAGFVGCALRRDFQRRGLQFRGATRNGGDNTLAVGSIGASTDWSKALDGVDTVIHLAARVHVMRDTAADPEAAFRETNVDATLCLSRQARDAGVRRLIFLSTIKVNGDETDRDGAFKADDAPAPTDAYGRSKLAAEHALHGLASLGGLDVVVIRPPLVYGPGVKGNFRTMLRWAERGLPLPFGSVDNRRSLVSVDNLTDLIVRCLESPAAGGHTFLASDGQDVSTSEIIRLLSASIGRRSPLVPCPPRILKVLAALVGRGGEMSRLLESLRVDIGATRDRLNWTPPWSMAEAFSRSAAYGW